MENEIILPAVPFKTIDNYLKDIEFREKNIENDITRITLSLNYITLSRQYIEKLLKASEVSSILDK